MDPREHCQFCRIVFGIDKPPKAHPDDEYSLDKDPLGRLPKGRFCLTIKDKQSENVLIVFPKNHDPKELQRHNPLEVLEDLEETQKRIKVYFERKLRVKRGNLKLKVFIGKNKFGHQYSIYIVVLPKDENPPAQLN